MSFTYAYNCYLKRKYPAWALLAVLKYLEGRLHSSDMALRTTEDHHTYNALCNYRAKCVSVDKGSEEGSLGKSVLVEMSIVAHNRTREFISKIHETKTCLPPRFFEKI